MAREPDMTAALRSATVAELAWVDQRREPDALPVTPLLLGADAAIAYPYAYADLARAIAASDTAALVLSERRMTGPRWAPVALIGRPRLVEDRDGELFTAELLTQELRKYPPSRTLADSVILRREHWWYLPRLVVVVELEAAIPVPARDDGHQVLAVARDEGLHVDTVRVVDGDGPDRASVASLGGRSVPDGPAVLLGHDFSEPDLERWTPWVSRGVLADGELTVTERPTRTTLEPPLTLRQRFRRQRDLERSCRAALTR